MSSQYTTLEQFCNHFQDKNIYIYAQVSSFATVKYLSELNQIAEFHPLPTTPLERMKIDADWVAIGLQSTDNKLVHISKILDKLKPYCDAKPQAFVTYGKQLFSLSEATYQAKTKAEADIFDIVCSIRVNNVAFCGTNNNPYNNPNFNEQLLKELNVVKDFKSPATIFSYLEEKLPKSVYCTFYRIPWNPTDNKDSEVYSNTYSVFATINDLRAQFPYLDKHFDWLELFDKIQVGRFTMYECKLHHSVMEDEFKLTNVQKLLMKFGKLRV
jgi:hypothetical protein